MSAVTDILKQVPLDDLAKQLGVSPSAAKTASTQAITSLLAGMTSNAADASGEESLAGALVKHAAAGETFAQDGVDLKTVDTKDGAKIVKHALGADTTKAAAAVAEKTGTDQSLLQQLLPILAPIVIAYIANKAFNKAGTSSGGSSSGAGGLLGGLLGGILGGSGSSSTSSGGAGDILGGLLGGGASGNGLGGMLGGLLGGALGSDEKTTKTQQSSGGVLGGLLDSIF